MSVVNGWRLFYAVLVCASVLPGWVQAAEIRVAVAANFTLPATDIAALFEDETGHTVTLSFGSTGQLYSQIAQGAPFDVFLSADAERAERAVEEGLAIPESRFTYAIGRLALYSTDETLVMGLGTVRDADFSRLAIANPVTAPYGAATVEVLEGLGVYGDVEKRIVLGGNLGQVFTFVQSGNAQLGFVALAQIINRPGGSRFVIPADLHTPIAQDAIVVAASRQAEVALAFTDFLKSETARAIIVDYGYDISQ